MTEKILRHDKGTIQEKHLTDEGFLKVDAIVTRTGIFPYLNTDGSVRKELRAPNDVLKEESLKSMEMIPVTLLHPQERVVDSTNARKLARGSVGQKISHDGRMIKAKIMITDQEAIDAISNGVQELSLGYSVNLVKDSGTFEGERFDFRQTDIKYNHLAIVPKGRAQVAKIILDAEDAIQQIENNGGEPSKPKEKPDMSMVQRKLDGINYEAAPEIVNALDRAEESLRTVTSENEGLKSSNSEMKAKLDAAKEKVAALEKVDHSAEIQNAVKSRISLVSTASKHLDEKELEGIELKADEEIKLSVIKKYSPEVNLDACKDAVYLNARFDAALENNPEIKKDADVNLGRQREALRQKKDSDSKDIILDAQEKYANDLTNNWKKADK